MKQRHKLLRDGRERKHIGKKNEADHLSTRWRK